MEAATVKPLGSQLNEVSLSVSCDTYQVSANAFVYILMYIKLISPPYFLCTQDLLVNIAQRVERIEKMVEKLGHRLKEKSGGNSRHSSKEDDQGVIINGIDVLRIPAKDEYAYGLRLMEVLFTKEEMSESLLFESKKSDRKGLDQERVSQLFSLVDKRYGKNTLNIKKFKDKANQKCRDTRM